MGGKTATSSQQVSIPPDVLARYNSVNANAQSVAQKPFQTYGSEFVAPVNETQSTGISQIGSASTEAQPYFDTARTGLGAAQAGTQPVNAAAEGLAAAGAGAVNPSDLNSAAINKYMNPYLQNVLGSTASLINQENQQAAGGESGNAIRSGAFGGDREGVAQANLQQQQILAEGNVFSGIASNAYNSALGAAQQQQGVNLEAGQANRAALETAAQNLSGIGNTAYTQGANTAAEMANLGTGAQAAGLSGGQAVLGAGTVEQQTQQAQDTAKYNQFLQQQSYPFQTAQFLANIAEGTGALSGSTTTTTQPGGFFSDKRLKEGVEPIGKLFDGQTIVRFRYKGEPHTRIGLIAQDVEKHHPEAVGEHASGFKVVEHGAATEDAARRGHFRGGGLVPSSQGGIVDITHLGEHYAGGGITPVMVPGVGAGDLNAILQMQKTMYGTSPGARLNGGPRAGLNVPSSGGGNSIPVAGAGGGGGSERRSGAQNGNDLSSTLNKGHTAYKQLQKQFASKPGASPNATAIDPKTGYPSSTSGVDVSGSAPPVDASATAAPIDAGSAAAPDAAGAAATGAEDAVTADSAGLAGGAATGAASAAADAGAAAAAEEAASAAAAEMAAEGAAEMMAARGGSIREGLAGGGSTYPTGDEKPRLRLVKAYANGARATKVYKDRDWGEYRVRHYEGGVHQKDADYHTDDADDAHSTAQGRWLREAPREGLAGGGMPYSEQAGLDIPDENAHNKLITPASAPKPVMSGLQQLAALPSMMSNVSGMMGAGSGVSGGDTSGGSTPAGGAKRGGLVPRAHREDGGATIGDSPDAGVTEASAGALPQARADSGLTQGEGNALKAIAMVVAACMRDGGRIAKAGGGASGSWDDEDVAPGGGSEYAGVDENNVVAKTLKGLVTPAKTPSLDTSSDERPAPGLAAAKPAPRPRPAPRAPTAAPVAAASGEAPVAASGLAPARAPQTDGLPPIESVPAPTAPPSGLGGAQQPAAAPVQPPAAVAPPAGAGMKDKLKSIWDSLKSADSSTLQGAIPLLSGLAAMGTAPTRSLGVALSAGLGAGANSYMQTKQSLADIAQTQATTGLTSERAKTQGQITAQDAIANAKNASLRTINGIDYVVLPDGRTMAQTDWIKAGYPALAGAAQATAAVNAQPGVYVPPNQPKAVPAPTGPWKREVGLDGTPAPSPAADKAVDDDATTNMSRLPAERNLIAANNQQSLSAIRAQANAARDTNSQFATMARTVAALPENGAMATGPLAPYRRQVISWFNDVVTTLGHGPGSPNDWTVDAAQQNNALILDKLHNNAAAIQASSAGQHAYSALDAMMSTNPSASIPKEAAIDMIANLMVPGQKAIDGAKYVERQRGTNQSPGFNPETSLQHFRHDYSDQYYQNEKEHLKALIRNRDDLEGVAAGNMSPAQQRAVERVYGNAPITRYIWQQ